MDKGWLDSLKVGDVVALDTSIYSCEWCITQITSITPTRRIRVEKWSMEFDGNTGQERCKKDSWRHRRRIEPVTQQIRDEIRKSYLVARANEQKWRMFTLGKLERIVSIIDE